MEQGQYYSPTCAGKTGPHVARRLGEGKCGRSGVCVAPSMHSQSQGGGMNGRRPQTSPVLGCVSNCTVQMMNVSLDTTCSGRFSGAVQQFTSLATHSTALQLCRIMSHTTQQVCLSLACTANILGTGLERLLNPPTSPDGGVAAAGRPRLPTPGARLSYSWSPPTPPAPSTATAASSATHSTQLNKCMATPSGHFSRPRQGAAAAQSHHGCILPDATPGRVHGTTGPTSITTPPHSCVD